MDALIFGDTVRSPALRHEVPAPIIDPFIYAERDGKPHAVISSLDAAGAGAARAELEILSPEELGWDELASAGLGTDRATIELSLRAVQRLGITEAAVPAEFPLALADRLRDAGVRLDVDNDSFLARRRSKGAAELEGIRRATEAAQAGFRKVAEMLAAATPENGELSLDGSVLTSERLKEEIERAIAANGARIDEMIVAAGPGLGGHDYGSGPILENTPIVVDLWPQDRESACFTDLTRTFLVGEPSEELLSWRRHTLEAQERAIEAIRPGIGGRELFEVAAESLGSHGYSTQLTKAPGEQLTEGFYWGLGHGVGLEVHEAPYLGRSGTEELQSGDVLALEPGVSSDEIGEYRVEDLLLVTEDGSELLNDLPYELDPAAWP
jgi:Xaa-Pro aminopeptidase